MNLRRLCLKASLMILILIASFMFTNSVIAKIINIPDDFPTIQEGINFALDGDTLLVAAGKYVENINFYGKEIIVKSDSGPNLTIIDGNHFGSVVTFYSGETSTSVIDGFTIQNGYAENGAGIYCYNYSSPIITNNIITRNSVNWGGNGGGICCFNFSNPKIINNTITSNYAVLGGNGGGIRCSKYSDPEITNNIIKNNFANDGGGIWCSNFSRPMITNNIIKGNFATNGGGIWCFNFSNPEIINNTITSNSAYESGGGIYCSYESSPEIINNIITSSTNGEGIYCTANSSPTISYNDVWDNADGNYAGCTPGPGDISDNPLFINPVNGDYHLQAKSSCIDAGTNEKAPTEDIEENPRPIDGDRDSIATTDMGAYEYVGACPLVVTIKDQSKLNFLRKFRDRVLSNSKIGREYVKLYYKHSKEATMLLVKDTKLRKEARKLFRKVVPEIRLILDGKTNVLNPMLKKEILSFLSQVQEMVSPEFKAAIEKLMDELWEEAKEKKF